MARCLTLFGLHNWGKWCEPFPVNVNGYDGDEYTAVYQRRSCERCGFVQDMRATVAVPLWEDDEPEALSAAPVGEREAISRLLAESEARSTGMQKDNPVKAEGRQP